MLGLTLSFAVSLFVLGQTGAQAGERLPDISALPNGFRYCPAPGANNTEFNSSYFAIDAQTGQMSRYVDGQPRQELEPVDTEEKILFVAPTINVENRYVPYPGAAPQQAPREFADSNHGYNPNRPQQYPSQYPPQQPGYSQPRQDYQQQEYAHHNPNGGPNPKRPWWKKVLR